MKGDGTDVTLVDHLRFFNRLAGEVKNHYGGQKLIILTKIFFFINKMIQWYNKIYSVRNWFEDFF